MITQICSSLCRNCLEYQMNSLTHVQHSVSFVEDKEFQILERNFVFLNKIHKTTRCPKNNSNFGLRLFIRSYRLDHQNNAFNCSFVPGEPVRDYCLVLLQVQIILVLFWINFYILGLSKMILTRPKRIGPILNNWYFTKIIWDP